jgi:hypothetical protein
MGDHFGFIVKPVVRIGHPTPASQPGCKFPAKATSRTYDELKDAAPLHLAELAAILTGRLPFELEPRDDPNLVADYSRVLARLEQAVVQGRLSETPTLAEAVEFALEIGIPIANRSTLLSAAGLGCPAPASEAPGRRSRSDFDPELQQKTVAIAADLRTKRGGPAKKSEVAEELKRAEGLACSVESIMRRTRAIRR